jgi:hypothetical protein
MGRGAVGSIAAEGNVMSWERDERGGISWVWPDEPQPLWEKALRISESREFSLACPRCRVGMILRLATPIDVPCETDPRHGLAKDKYP